MKIFKLPDLGEGLQEAEIVEWHVKAGDEIAADQPLVSVETAKAIVDIPSPYDGRVAKLYGEVGQPVHVGAPLAGFEGGAETADTGTVVGEMQVGQEVRAEAPAALAPAAHGGAGIRATPAVRALARQLKVELEMVTPSGADGVITREDVQRAARVLAEADDEAIHDLRVAIRRLRTLLKIARRLFGRWHTDVVRRAYADVMKATGELRDEEVLEETLEGASEAPSFTSWLSDRAARERSLRAAVVARIERGELDRARLLLKALLVFPASPDKDRELARFARRTVERARLRVEERREEALIQI